VLVVDDLNTMTRVVDGMLRKCGFANVDQVHDGPTGLQKICERSRASSLSAIAKCPA